MIGDYPFGFPPAVFAAMTSLGWFLLLLVASVVIQGAGNLASKQRRTARAQKVHREVDTFDRVVLAIVALAAWAALLLNLPLVWQQWAAVLGTPSGLTECWVGLNRTVVIQLIAALVTALVAVFFSAAMVFGFVWMTERHRNNRLFAVFVTVLILVSLATVALAIGLRSMTVPGVC